MIVTFMFVIMLMVVAAVIDRSCERLALDHHAQSGIDSLGVERLA